MKIVYIAGPYRAPTAWERDCNIHEARRLGALVTALGAMPLIPHSNTAHFDGLATDDFWLEGTKELMRRCDAVIMTPDWQRSTGARGEHTEALKRGMPVFYSLASLRAWLDVVEAPVAVEASALGAGEEPAS